MPFPSAVHAVQSRRRRCSLIGLTAASNSSAEGPPPSLALGVQPATGTGVVPRLAPPGGLGPGRRLRLLVLRPVSIQHALESAEVHGRALAAEGRPLGPRF